MSKEMLKVTLSSGKTVVLRRLEIRMLRTAEKAANGAQGMQFVMEIMKQLVFSVDSKRVTATQLEDLDALFDVSEFMQLQGVVGKFVEGAQETPKIETVFGEQ